jgi:hypothetical protein
MKLNNVYLNYRKCSLSFNLDLHNFFAFCIVGLLFGIHVRFCQIGGGGDVDWVRTAELEEKIVCKSVKLED